MKKLRSFKKTLLDNLDLEGSISRLLGEPVLIIPFYEADLELFPRTVNRIGLLAYEAGLCYKTISLTHNSCILIYLQK